MMNGRPRAPVGVNWRERGVSPTQGWQGYRQRAPAGVSRRSRPQVLRDRPSPMMTSAIHIIRCGQNSKPFCSASKEACDTGFGKSAVEGKREHVLFRFENITALLSLRVGLPRSSPSINLRRHSRRTLVRSRSRSCGVCLEQAAPRR